MWTLTSNRFNHRACRRVRARWRCQSWASDDVGVLSSVSVLASASAFPVTAVVPSSSSSSSSSSASSSSSSSLRFEAALADLRASASFRRFSFSFACFSLRAFFSFSSRSFSQSSNEMASSPLAMRLTHSSSHCFLRLAFSSCFFFSAAAFSSRFFRSSSSLSLYKNDAFPPEPKALANAVFCCLVAVSICFFTATNSFWQALLLASTDKATRKSFLASSRSPIFRLAKARR
mmetsp:Transcript_5922/g.15107  ORF Transcript_5922/g.15107 Transcript_5922/m.15107 type:complete len:232 (+) Transcript_5922:1126-1821(+)